MGYNSKKKKKKGKGRGPSKDHASHAGEDQDLLSEELTALSSIFQDDIEIASEVYHTQFVINIRPYSNDMMDEDLNVSARLLVRCLPGYPHKCPKIQIIPEKRLSPEDANRLLSLLVDQANISAREGRVMIFNLVEAAQEFLSEIASAEQSMDAVRYRGSDKEGQSLYEDTSVRSKSCFFEEPYAFVPIDLYSECGDKASWADCVTKVENHDPARISKEQTGIFEKARSKNDLLDPPIAANMVKMVKDDNFHQNTKSEVSHSAKKGAKQQVFSNLPILDEETDSDNKSLSHIDHDLQSVVDPLGIDSDVTLHEDLNLLREVAKVDSCDSEYESFTSSSSSLPNNESESKKRDLLMIHLLHLACASKGSLSHALPEISSELYKLGILSQRARDLATEPQSSFGPVFERAFGHHMTSSCISQFWKPVSNFNEDAASRPNSRYLNDFEEIHSLGRGGFGHVVLCRNKLDGRHYAVKKIRLKDKDIHLNEKILREVATLSRLQHQHVVRYYQAWFETEYGEYHGQSTSDSRTVETDSWSCASGSLTTGNQPDNPHESTYLYIQMEYCPRTVRQDFESCSSSLDKDPSHTWHLFRQIVEGIAHIHNHGIIHRDLTPSNIFFDARNDIKIGDFGLAKFLKLEQLDHDQYLPTETTGVSIDGTGHVGTFFYTAPEIEQKWAHINEKVDMYSLGVVFFELWHPFATAMERHIVLSDLKQKGVLPSSWVARFPKQSSILRRLMSPSPSDRPSATELLQQDLPPRMEDEWLNDILRTIQSSDDTYVYDRVVSTIFDMNRLVMRAHPEDGGSIKAMRDESFFIQYTPEDSQLRDNGIEIIKDLFRQHGARRMEIFPMRVLDGCHAIDRKSVKALTSGGDMLELCHELRSPFVDWVAKNQKLSFKRYEISSVYRRAIGHSAPNRFFQGDFDIIGGITPLPEAEAIKVVMDLTTRFPHLGAIDIRLNHGQVWEAIWSWVGIASDLKQNVAELLSSIGSSRPQSASHKSNWGFIRRQLLQDLNLSEAVVDRLQTATLRFCGSADQALARLRGALYPDKLIRKALEELSTLFSYLRIWNIEKHVSLDILMPPNENYYRGLFFQIYVKENCHGSVSEGTLLAVGGRYDYLVHQMWNREYKFNPPGAVGVSLALEKILHHCPVDIRPYRIDPNINVLVCSRGGGGFLQERMELVAELWQANMKAQFVPLTDPSLTEQYEYANEHDIRCLIIITEAGLAQTGLVKVRHLELKKEKEVERGNIIKFLMEVANSAQSRNLSVWS